MSTLCTLRQLLLVTLLTVLVGAAGTGGEPTLPSPVHGLWLLWPLNAEPRIGVLEAIDQNRAVTFRSSAAHSIPMREIHRIQRLDRFLPGPPPTSYLHFHNGDRVTGTLVESDADRIRFKPNLGPESTWELPISQTRGIRLTRPRAPTSERCFWEWEHGTRQADVLVFTNGDELTGIWEGATADTIRLRERESVEQIPRSQVAAIGFCTTRPFKNAAAEKLWRVTLNDGSRLNLREVKLSSSGTLEARTRFDVTIRLRLVDVLAFEPENPDRVFLSDVVSLKETNTPYFTARWPLVRDGSVGMNFLRLGSNVFERGIGVHSRSLVQIDLNGEYEAFGSWIGLDDRTGKQGRVALRVLVDDVESFAKTEIDGSTKPSFLRIDLKGAKRLRLEVDFGMGGDVQDHFNWADAFLVRRENPR